MINSRPGNEEAALCSRSVQFKYTWLPNISSVKCTLSSFSKDIAPFFSCQTLTFHNRGKIICLLFHGRVRRGVAWQFARPTRTFFIFVQFFVLLVQQFCCERKELVWCETSCLNRVTLGNVSCNLPRLRRSHVRKGVVLSRDAKWRCARSCKDDVTLINS